jgi:hypothetical protein
MGVRVYPFICFHPLRQGEVARLAVPGYNRARLIPNLSNLDKYEDVFEDIRGIIEHG